MQESCELISSGSRNISNSRRTSKGKRLLCVSTEGLGTTNITSETEGDDHQSVFLIGNTNKAGINGRLNSKQHLNLDLNTTSDVSHTPATSKRKVKFQVVIHEGESVYSDNSNDIAPLVERFILEYGDLFDLWSTTILEDSNSINIMRASEDLQAADQFPRPAQFHTSKDSSLRTSENCYIIKLKRDAKQKTVNDLRHILLAVNGTVKATYTHSLKGLMACFEYNQLPFAFLNAINWVEIVERDQLMNSTIHGCNKLPWGLAKITKDRATFRNANVSQELSGDGVSVYVIDSGVWEKHPEFEGRARLGYSIFENKLGKDCSGHGTEVASVIIGKNVGVARKASIIALQVLDCSGQAQNSDIINALEWILVNRKPPGIINLSVGGAVSPSLDDAVKNAIDRGFVVIVAAGNSAQDACLMSPSRVSEAIVIGASTEDNKRAGFSNFGKCISLFAPGTNILAASSPTRKKKIGRKFKNYGYVSGTSLAAPFASGVAALLLQKYPAYTPRQVKDTMLSMAKTNYLEDSNLLSSPNIFLQAPDNVILTSPISGHGEICKRIEIYMTAVVIAEAFLVLALIAWQIYRRKKETK